jgi:hypothetical protein
MSPALSPTFIAMTKQAIWPMKNMVATLMAPHRSISQPVG